MKSLMEFMKLIIHCASTLVVWQEGKCDFLSWTFIRRLCRCKFQPMEISSSFQCARWCDQSNSQEHYSFMFRTVVALTS